MTSNRTIVTRDTYRKKYPKSLDKQDTARKDNKYFVELIKETSSSKWQHYKIQKIQLETSMPKTF